METRREKIRKERTKTECPRHTQLGTSKFVCDLFMVNALRCVEKTEETKMRKTRLRAMDLCKPITSPVQSKLTSPHADKASSILKISVDLRPILMSAMMQPLKTDGTERSFERLGNGHSQHSSEHKILTEDRTISAHQNAHPLDNKLILRTMLPPLESHFTQPFNYCLKHHNVLPPIAEKQSPDIVLTKSEREENEEEEKEEEETEAAHMKRDSKKDKLNQNIWALVSPTDVEMMSTLKLPDISVSNIQMLIERVEKTLDRGKVKLPEIDHYRAQGEQTKMPPRNPCSPPLISRRTNQPVVLRLQKKTHNQPWSVSP